MLWRRNLLFLFAVAAVIIGVYFFWATRLPQVKIGAGEPLAPNGFLAHVVEKYKFDERNGVDLEFVFTDPIENQRLFREKKEDLAWTPLLTAARYVVDGVLDARIIGPLENAFIVYAVKADSPFQSFEDLRSAKFGSLPKTAASFDLTVLQMRKMGLDPEQDFKVTFSNYPELKQFLLEGTVDFIAVHLGQVWELFKEKKVRHVASLEELWEKATGRKFPFIALTTTQEWLDANPGLDKKVRAALTDAAKYVEQNPGIWEAEKSYLKIEDSAELEEFKKQYAQYVIGTSWAPGDIDNIRYLYKEATLNGLLPEFNADRVVVP